MPRPCRIKGNCTFSSPSVVTHSQALKYLGVLTQQGLALHLNTHLELKDRIILGVDRVSQSVEKTLDLPFISLSQKDRIVLLRDLK